MNFTITGQSQQEFHTETFEWRALLDLLQVAGLISLREQSQWGFPDGYGLDGIDAFDRGVRLRAWRRDHPHLQRWIRPSAIAVLEIEGRRIFVKRGTPGARSPYTAHRKRIEELAEFMVSSAGFEVG
jgi:hypothetical protein